MICLLSDSAHCLQALANNEFVWMQEQIKLVADKEDLNTRFLLIKNMYTCNLPMETRISIILWIETAPRAIQLRMR